MAGEVASALSWVINTATFGVFRQVKHRLLIAAIAPALFLATPLAAHAAGTPSGTTISNSAQLTCSVCGVGGISSVPVSFLVDNKVNVTVAENAGAAIGVNAGQLAAVTAFTVTNLGNTVQDYALTPANIASGAVLFAGTDNFDATACIVRVESGIVPGYDPTDTAAYIDELIPDASRVVYVVCSIPAAQAAGDQAIVSLTAATLQGGAPNIQGGATVATAGTNTAGVDIVFADGAGSDDAIQDGKHSARGAYRVGGAVTLTKTVANIQDPYGCNAAPGVAPGCKLVPGSILTYRVEMIIAGAGNVTGLVLTDPIPANMTYVPGSIIANGAAKTDAADADLADFGFTAPNTVTFAPGAVTAPATVWFTFRATIN